MAIQKGDHILEIGPGKGALTEHLISSPAERIIMVEIDTRLGDWLKERFGKDSRFQLIQGNILDQDIENIFHASKIRILGNLPYSITSPILFKLLEHRQWIQDFTVTIQLEVANRIVSDPGSKIYGIPSVLFQTFGQVDRLFSIPASAFSPVPKVDSAVIRCSFYRQPMYKIDDLEFYSTVIKKALGQRRKMLRNSLKPNIESSPTKDNLEIDMNRRPEHLSVPQWVQLSNILKNT